MERTLALIQRAHQGDKEAREILFQENTGLIWSIVKRFKNRGVELEDLYQIGSIGLLKAVEKFDPAYGVRFSTYAVPMITGEIKRFLRDDGMLKVSRSMKEICYRAHLVREAMEKEQGREPGLEEIADEMAVTVEELVMALESAAEVESLQKTIYQGDGNDISLLDKLEEQRNGQEEALNRLLLEEMLGELEARERKLIYMRYFQDKTQSEIARIMGVSQVQVSRMEKRILDRLRKRYL